MLEMLFKNKKPNIQHLLSFGFSKVQGGYCYSTTLVDGQFTFVITISDEGQVHTDVIEVSSNDAYVLHLVPDACGTFIDGIKNEYKAILASIAEKCFVRDVFKSDYAKQVIDYIHNTYQDELEYLWEKFPQNAIFRRKDNKKWYAALLVLSTRKIGLYDDRIVDIIDLRIDTKIVSSTIDGKRYFPGYHMNKKHWFTICLDGSVPIKEIFHWIDSSYALAKK